MSNRSSSKQHGLSNVKRMQPKSTLRARRNKAKATQRKAQRREVVKNLTN